ncbi:glyoxylate/hydroxypyruvate reductase A [Delftia sp. SD018]|uniref:2-hydroxyacid dehydrogenase n=1 Tax=unclassified Delftia TaxID=2613839 RepID=UPI001A96366E|nr:MULTISPECIES: glyoxylate/hydroxypyruvate reductase A [unclassified Delftia]MBO0986017.1 glyoxylate/hydroxypyruvate reductase A [Delftia sp. SD083]MBO1032709.1 glyoxylate/hydroxypyruvate reductase A [Delftia sp. SD018]
MSGSLSPRAPLPPLPFVCAPGYPAAPAWLQALQAALPEERVVALDTLDADQRAACEVAIVANPQPADLRTLPRLQWVHSVWAGVERLVADLGDTDLRIVRLVDPQLAATMAEAVLAWTLYLHRDMPRYARQQAARQWLAHDGVRAQDRTVSLLGLGALGKAAAQRLLSAGFQVRGWSRTPRHIEGVQCHAGDAELPAMLAQTDILVCLLPLTPQTRGIVGAQALAALPAHASLINFARGPIVDDAALCAALDSGRLAHAVLDVFEQEPLPESSWQWAHPAVTVLPHISAPTDRATASAIVAGNIRRWRSSGELPQAVDAARGY